MALIRRLKERRVGSRWDQWRRWRRWRSVPAGAVTAAPSLDCFADSSSRHGRGRSGGARLATPSVDGGASVDAVPLRSHSSLPARRRSSQPTRSHWSPPSSSTRSETRSECVDIRRPAPPTNASTGESSVRVRCFLFFFVHFFRFVFFLFCVPCFRFKRVTPFSRGPTAGRVNRRSAHVAHFLCFFPTLYLPWRRDVVWRNPGPPLPRLWNDSAKWPATVALSARSSNRKASESRHTQRL